MIYTMKDFCGFRKIVCVCLPTPEWKICWEKPSKTMWYRSVWKEDQAFGEAEKGCEFLLTFLLLRLILFFHRGKSLCLVSYMLSYLVSFSGAADRFWRWTSSGTFSGTPWSHSLSRRYSNDFTAAVNNVGRPVWFKRANPKIILISHQFVFYTLVNNSV